MTANPAEEDKVHPLVANLVGLKFVPRAAGSSIFRYDRDEMMRLRTVPNSVARPDYLSVDFDGDDGKFSPFKWLEYRWELEGVKNKVPNKKLQDSLKTDCEDRPGLSPQRRGFSSGCRAEDKKEKDGAHVKDEGWSTVEGRTEKERDRDRLGSTSGSSKWRSGVSGGTEKATKSSDFKLPFQKGSIAEKSRSSNWKTIEGKEKQGGSFSASGKFIPSKTYRNDDRPEKVPEWAEGPTTMDDMIELRGFEESKKKKKNKEREEKENRKESTERKEKLRPNSNPSSNEPAEALPSAIPSTDEEFAALLGLLDTSSNEISSFKVDDPKPTSTGSRLSRFFKSAPTEEVHKQQNGSSLSRFFPPANEVNADNVRRVNEASPNPVLAMIFAHSNGSESPARAQSSTNVAPVRLEDIEKNIPSRGKPETNFTDSGDPLKDPIQHSHFMDKLSRMARQQEDAQRISPTMDAQAYLGSRPLMNAPPMQTNHPMFPVPPMNVPAPNLEMYNAHFHHNLNVQFQSAIQAATASLGAIPPPPIMEAIRRDVFRNVMIQHQAAVQMAMQHQQQQQQHQALQHPRGNRPPAMIPSSVQRHMTKHSSHPGEDRKEKDRDDDDGKFEALKKMQMQQQYGALISAVQNGLPLSAFKGSSSAQQPASRQPTGTQQQMNFMAAAQYQQAQAAHMAMLRRQEMMKSGLDFQNATSSASLEDRRPSPPYPPGSLLESDFPTELSQVGPIQTPLEKLLAAHGLPASKYESSRQMPAPRRPDVSHMAMSLEELERQLMEKSKLAQ